jgi:hypothetical protein
MDGCQPAKDNEVLGCEWEDLVSVTSSELLAFDSSMNEDHRGIQLAVNNAESCGYLLAKLAGGGDISDRTHPSASSQAYYQEMLMGEDNKEENAQVFPEDIKVIPSEEIQDNLNEENACNPLGCKVRMLCNVAQASHISSFICRQQIAVTLAVIIIYSLNLFSSCWHV